MSTNKIFALYFSNFNIYRFNGCPKIFGPFQSDSVRLLPKLILN